MKSQRGDKKNEVAMSALLTLFFFIVFFPLRGGADNMVTGVTVAAGTIDYDDAGFTPKKITILKGDSIIFRNQSDEILFLLSDPHPTATNFSRLNVGNISKNGGSTAVMFTETGNFGYHNHMNLYHRGHVIVVDEIAPKEPKVFPPLPEESPPIEPAPENKKKEEKEEKPKARKSKERVEEEESLGEKSIKSEEEREDLSKHKKGESDSPPVLIEEDLVEQRAPTSEDVLVGETQEGLENAERPLPSVQDEVRSYILAQFLNVDAGQANILIPPIFQKDEGVSEYTIYLSENVQSATLDLRYSTLEADVAKIPVPIRVVSLTAQGTIFLSIPEGAVIRGPSEWDEKIMLPTIKEDEWGLRLLNYTDDVFVKLLVRVGLKGQKLTLSKPVRLLLPDVADHLVGYVVNDVFTPITAVCDSDTPESAEQQLEAEGNCMIVRGSDIAVWTQHFTGFITYKDVPSTLSPPDSIAVPTLPPAQEERQFEPALRKTITLLLGGATLLVLVVLILFVTDRIRARKS